MGSNPDQPDDEPASEEPPDGESPRELGLFLPMLADGADCQQLRDVLDAAGYDTRDIPDDADAEFGVFTDPARATDGDQPWRKGSGDVIMQKELDSSGMATAFWSDVLRHIHREMEDVDASNYDVTVEVWVDDVE